MLKSLFLFVVLVGLLFPGTAYQQSPAPLPLVQCAEGNPLNCTLGDLLDVPVRAYNFLLGMAGLILLAMIIWGGMRMTLFYASELPESELVNAKLTITRGIFGFLIVAGSYLIVNLLLALLGFNEGSAVGRLLGTFGLL